MNWKDPLGLAVWPEDYYKFPPTGGWPPSSSSSNSVSPATYWQNLYNYARTQRAWGHQQYPGEANSSMRHCVVSCMVASNYGNAGARTAGIGNEVQGLVLHDIPDLWGRLSGERPWAAQWQDLQDNERGMQAAKKNCSKMSESETQQSCIQSCMGQ